MAVLGYDEPMIFFDWEPVSLKLNNLKIVAAGECFAVLEKSQPYPGQGGKSNFTNGRNLGLIEGALYALEIPFEEVHPSRWQKIMLTGKPDPQKAPPGSSRDVIQRVRNENRKKLKAFAAEKCQRLFPGTPLASSGRCTKPHEGAVDALLIAEYCRREYG